MKVLKQTGRQKFVSFKLIILILCFSIMNLGYSQSRFLYGYTSSTHSNYDITHFGNISLGQTVNPTGPIFSMYQNDNVSFELKNNYGYLQIGKSNNNNAFAPTAIPGTAVFRNLGGGANGMILNIPNNNNDGSSI